MNKTSSVYESVDDNRLSYAVSQKPTKIELMQERAEQNEFFNLPFFCIAWPYIEQHLAKISILLNIRRDNPKNSYERRVYGSVDDNSKS